MAILAVNDDRDILEELENCRMEAVVVHFFYLKYYGFGI